MTIHKWADIKKMRKDKGKQMDNIVKADDEAIKNAADDKFFQRVHEISLIRELLLYPAGYDVDLFGGMLNIRTTAYADKSGMATVVVAWGVEIYDDGARYPFNGLCGLGGTKVARGSVEFPMGQLDEACVFFVDKRHELKIGADYELG